MSVRAAPAASPRAQSVRAASISQGNNPGPLRVGVAQTTIDKCVADAHTAAQASIRQCVQQALAGLAAEHSATVQQLNAATAQLRQTPRAQTEVAQIQQVGEQQPSPSAGEIKQLQDANDALQKQNGDLQAQNRDLTAKRGNVSELADQNSKCQINLKNANEALQRAQENIDRLEAANRSNKSNCQQIAQLRSALNNIETSLANAKAAADASCPTPQPQRPPTIQRRGGRTASNRNARAGGWDPKTVPGLRHGQIWSPGTLF